MFQNFIDTLRRMWLQYCLESLIDQQATIDRVVHDAEMELAQLKAAREKETNRMAAERTRIRSAQLRLKTPTIQ